MDSGKRFPALLTYVVAAALLACAVLVSACGGGGSSSVSSSTTSEGSAGSTTASSETVGGKPIVLGSVASCTGAQAAAIGGACPTIEAWAEWTNAHGGINGHPVKMIVKDDGGDPAKALADVKSLVEQEHVKAIVGEYSAVDSTWAPYIDKTGVPVVGGATTEAPFATDANFYPSGSQVPTLLFGLLTEIKAVNKPKLAAFYCAEVPVCAGLVPVLEGLSSVVPGTELVASAKISATEPTYTAACLKAKEAGAESLYVAQNSDTLERVAEDCKQQGYEPLILGTSGVVSAQLAKNPALEGSISSIPNVPISDETLAGTKEMHEALSEYATSLSEESPQWNSGITQVWAGALLFQAAAEAAKIGPESTPAEVKKGLYALKEETLGGFSGPLTFTEGRPTFVGCYFVSSVSGGELTQPNGSKPSCMTQAQEEEVGAALGG